jgi:hypothetical protein
VAGKDINLNLEPQVLEGDKKLFVGAGRVSGKKKLSDNEIEAYADLVAIHGKGIGTKLSVPGIGAIYKHQLSPESSIEIQGEKRQKDNGEPWFVGVSYNKQFNDGGVVLSSTSASVGFTAPNIRTGVRGPGVRSPRDYKK